MMELLAPEPLSPLFRAGGALEGLNEDVTLSLAFVLVLLLVDQALVKRFIHPKVLPVTPGSGP